MGGALMDALLGGAIVQWAAAAAMFGLAAWILVLRFTSPVIRAFALLLGLVGARMTLYRIGDVVAGAGADTIWSTMGTYAALAAPMALAWFVAASIVDVRRRAARLVVLALCVAAAGAAVSMYAVDRCAHICVTEDAATVGSLALVTASLGPLFGVAALVLVLQAVVAAGAARTRANQLVGTAFALGAFLEAAMASASLAGPASLRAAAGPWEVASLWVGLAGWLPAGAAALVQGSSAVRQRFPILVRNAWAGYGLVIAAGILVGLTPTQRPWALALAGLVRLPLPLLGAIALVRHRLFGLDAQVRWTFARGFLAAAVLAAFFGASEIAVAFFSDRLGSQAVGVLAASVLVFFIAPLHRLGDRLARRVVPPVRVDASLNLPQRRRMYREQAALVWSDGLMGRKERLLLDHLRDRLGLEPADAAKIETSVLGMDAPRARGRARAAKR